MSWLLDDSGIHNEGSLVKYHKKPESFIEDYRRVTDFAASLGINGIVVFGFLRDSHGGIQAAKKVSGYAASKGVRLIPGVGVSWYGGVYYEGDHIYNLGNLLKKNPDAKLVFDRETILSAQKFSENAKETAVCPLHPSYREWIQEGLRWLCKEFDIGGVYLENGDFLLCHDPRCTKHREKWNKDEPEFFHGQYLAYRQALTCLEDQLQKNNIIFATYTSFVPTHLKCNKPAMFEHFPQDAIAQWTLSQVIRTPPLPLTKYLYNGVPNEAFDNEIFPSSCIPPNKRSTGFFHCASPFGERYIQEVSSIKETCLRAFRAGLEGVSIYGEITPLHIPAALNYLAFSHFIHWPEDSLMEFGRKTMGQVFKNEGEGEKFVEFLARWDAGVINDVEKKEIQKRKEEIWINVINSDTGKEMLTFRFWAWLSKMAEGSIERHTANFF